MKRRAAVSLDLSSVGQGYGVDQIVELLRAAGFTDFLVEVGGEIYAAGARPDGRAWRVGISRPVAGARPEDIYRVVTLRDQSFTTSGDYRQFFVQDGVRYSHHIDPATGYPVRSGLVSVSILAADSCTFVDGLGTAVLVIGRREGARPDRAPGGGRGVSGRGGARRVAARPPLPAHAAGAGPLIPAGRLR